MKILVVVDMQKDFIDGSLGTKEAQKIVINVIKKIKEYQKKDYKIVCTMDTHSDNYLNTLEGKNLPIKHCIKGSSGWELEPSIEKVLTGVSDVLAFEKETFGSKRLANTLSLMKNLDEVELVGLCGNICVIANAILIKTYCPNLPIVVDASCIASTTSEANLYAIKQMKDLQINIINEKK